MTDDLFIVSIDRTDPTRPIVRLGGEIDLSTRQALTDALADATAGGATAIEIDLTEVPFLDSSGLAAFVDLIAAGVDITITGTQPRVRRVLDLVELEGLRHR